MAREAANTETIALHSADAAKKPKSLLVAPKTGESLELMGHANRTLSAMIATSTAGVRSDAKNVMAASVCACFKVHACMSSDNSYFWCGECLRDRGTHR